MTDISLYRCYVYSYSPFHYQVRGKTLIGREYYFLSKKGKTIRNWVDYCPNCIAFVIKYNKFGGGIVVEKKGGFLIVQFDKEGWNQLNEKVCRD